jgi:hypothetical protein
MEQTWIDILSDPHHILADFIMNVGFEITFAWLTYLIIIKIIDKRQRKK